jgi:hypothetical protein
LLRAGPARCQAVAVHKQSYTFLTRATRRPWHTIHTPHSKLLASSGQKRSCPQIAQASHHAVTCKSPQEGYGLSWSPHTAGKLLSGSDDTHICLWDVEASHANKQAIDPLSMYKAHTSVVEDVSWHYSRHGVFGSVGDDKMLLM